VDDDSTLDGFFTALASASPAPGGGAAAALNAALGAALVSMVCNLTIGKPRYADHEATMIRVRDEADAARRRALALASDDAAAFAAVTDAYRLPKESAADRAARTAAIQKALLGAADVPLRTAALAAQVVRMCGEILDGSNVNVVSDVAVAAASARAALESAAVNVRVNLVSMNDADTRAATATALEAHLAAGAAAAEIVRAVENRIGS
jgi:formiminotetrahydrofolate cyclodeaminase